jgi:nodulation protein E
MLNPDAVVITGYETLNCLGLTRQEFARRLLAGESGVGLSPRLQAEGVGYPMGEIAGFDAAAHFGKEVELLDRGVQLALVAAAGALAMAGLSDLSRHYDPVRVGVITGVGLPGMESQDRAFRKFYGEASGRMHPYSIPRAMANAASSQISMRVGAQGASFTVATACASATHALGEAWRYLRSGELDLVLAGGADAPLTLGLLKAWEAMRVLAPAGPDAQSARRACRPFSADRAGLVLAEGAGMFVLERAARAQARGARCLAELAGYGASADAGHITQPSLRGAAQAMRQALQRAGLRPEDVDYINAHGTATKLNDATETAAIHEVFGPAAARLSVSSTKSMHGHAMGASGAVELAAVLTALEAQCVPPTANYTVPDPDCDLDVTPHQARPRQVRAALSNSFAFGGLNAVLAVRSCPPA